MPVFDLLWDNTNRFEQPIALTVTNADRFPLTLGSTGVKYPLLQQTFYQIRPQYVTLFSNVGRIKTAGRRHQFKLELPIRK